MINQAFTRTGNTELSLHHDEKRHRKCRSEGNAVDLSPSSSSAKHVMWDETGTEHYITPDANFKSSNEAMNDEVERSMCVDTRDGESGTSSCASEKEEAYEGSNKTKTHYITAEEAARRRHVMFVQHRKEHCYHEYDQVKQFRRQSEGNTNA